MTSYIKLQFFLWVQLNCKFNIGVILILSLKFICSPNIINHILERNIKSLITQLAQPDIFRETIQSSNSLL